MGLHKLKGAWRYQYTGLNGKRQTLNLGTDRQSAEESACRVKALRDARRWGRQPDAVTMAWLGQVNQDIKRLLAKHGLIDGHLCATSLDALITAFFRTASNNLGTRFNLQNAFDSLLRFFPGHKDIATITHADVMRWEKWLHRSGGRSDKPLAKATASRRIRRVKQLFNFAVKDHRLVENPFSVLHGGRESNRARDHYVDEETARAILAKIGDLEFRCVFILARWGALRIPSEALRLTWDDVDWEQNALRVFAPKTDAVRTVPICPEMREALDQLWDAASPGAKRIFVRMRISSTALTKRLHAAALAAAVKLWKKPWMNMRASRENDWNEQFPVSTTSAWLGHSPKVALEHYSRVPKRHFDQATKSPGAEVPMESPGPQEQRTQNRTQPNAKSNAD